MEVWTWGKYVNSKLWKFKADSQLCSPQKFLLKVDLSGISHGCYTVLSRMEGVHQIIKLPPDNLLLEWCHIKGSKLVFTAGRLAIQQ